MNGGLIPWKRKDWPDLRREFDDAFTKIFGEEASKMMMMKGFSPLMDVIETDTDVVVKAEVPGLEAKDLDITLRGKVLTIKGEKKEEREEKEESRHVSERLFGSFSRSFTLAVEVREDDVKSTFKNGVLTLTLPKAEHEQKKSVKINVE